MENSNLAFSTHNHSHCVDDAMAVAAELCADRGVRLTPLRKQVLALIWRSHKPLGAYTLLDMLATESTRQVAPPTVYRALDFLLEQRLIHRIGAINAYIGCPHPNHHHSSHFLLCDKCGRAEEIHTHALSDAIKAAATDTGFVIQRQSLEVFGLCPLCQTDSNNV